MITRREALATLSAAALLPLVACTRTPEPVAAPFRLRHVLASALYGEMPLDVILHEVARTGSECIDIWCRVHGNQREQISEMGDHAFAALLAKHRVRLGVSTRYPLGPFKLQDELAWVKRFGGEAIVTGSPRMTALEGGEARAAVRTFLDELAPHAAKAEELGVTIAIENHSNQLLWHPDALRAFAEFNRSPRVGIAFAPHHLHHWVGDIPALIRDLGTHNLPFIYLQEHAPAIAGKTAKEIEMQQLPGFGGGLDYRPIVQALRDVRFSGLAEIFMHPTPRGIPILPTAAEVSAAVMRSRAYIDDCLRQTTG